LHLQKAYFAFTVLSAFIYSRNVLMNSGETQTTIASELAICESEIDERVLLPINKLLEVNIHSMQLYVLSLILFCFVL